MLFGGGRDGGKALRWALKGVNKRVVGGAASTSTRVGDSSKWVCGGGTVGCRRG